MQSSFNLFLKKYKSRLNTASAESVKAGISHAHKKFWDLFFRGFLHEKCGNKSLNFAGFDLSTVDRIKKQLQLLQEVLVDFERNLKENN